MWRKPARSKDFSPKNVPANDSSMTRNGTEINAVNGRLISL